MLRGHALLLENIQGEVWRAIVFEIDTTTGAKYVHDIMENEDILQLRRRVKQFMKDTWPGRDFAYVWKYALDMA